MHDFLLYIILWIFSINLQAPMLAGCEIFFYIAYETTLYDAQKIM